MPMRISALSGRRPARGGGRFSFSWPALVRRLDKPGAWRRGIVLLNLGLVVLAADYAAEIVWTWAQPGASQAAIGPSLSMTGAVTSQSSDYALLKHFDPFHRAAVKTPEREAANAVATTLDLKLFGLRAGLGEDEGSAIIRTPDKKQGAYRVGDELMDGVTLRRILPDRVVISHRGTPESLFLDDDAKSVLSLASGEKKKSPAKAGVQLADLDSPEALMTAVHMSPRIEANRITGYVLSPGKDGQLLARLGLKDGDVLLSVNGMRLTNAEKIKDAREDLRQAKSVRIEIERGGNKKLIELSD